MKLTHGSETAATGSSVSAIASTRFLVPAVVSVAVGGVSI